MALAHLVREAGWVTDDERGHGPMSCLAICVFPLLSPQSCANAEESPFAITSRLAYDLIGPGRLRALERDAAPLLAQDKIRAASGGAQVNRTRGLKPIS
jgi:hypothetical protein